MNLSLRIQASNYLTTLLEQNPDYSDFAQGKRLVDTHCIEALMDEVASYEVDLFSQTQAFTQQLRQDKGRFSLLWSMASLCGAIDFKALGKLQSEFAALCVEQALRAAMHSTPITKLYAGQGAPEVSQSGLFVVAMGKLGGYDLNYSSDIDLVAFYDKERFVCPKMQGTTYVATQILRIMSSILTGNSPGELIWRVDWRLRPHASLRNLTMAMQSAGEFYHFHAQPWHRLAMIKARVVAGDINAGNGFLADLSPFIWRHDLDYRALDELQTLKHKINREHPELKQQRQQPADAPERAEGFNLKLGAGGIREIEFMVNAMQLIWGGRKPKLRVTNTLAALDALVESGLFDQDKAAGLAAAYEFHRRAENAMQMLENTQRYHIPEHQPNQDKLLALLSMNAWSDFTQALAQHRAVVSTEFAALFWAEEGQDEPDSSESGPRADAAKGRHWDKAELSERSTEIISLWKRGFRNYGVQENYASAFHSLVRQLDAIIHAGGLDTDAAIMQLDAFFHSLPPGGQYFRLLQQYPALLDKLTKPLLHSAAMAVLLQQSPHIVDRFLEASQPLAAPAKLDTSIIFFTQDFETRLQNLRTLANEELYLIYWQYFNGDSDPRQFERQLTYLATELIAVCLQVTCDELKLTQPPIAVIGFGKLGMGAMMPMSDLDLVFIFDDIENMQLAGQFASKLATVIATPMKQGRVYELDTRLRPSGKSGAATISLNSFHSHQLEQAQTWAHLALVPAQFIAGDAKIGAKFTALKREILSKPRDLDQFRNDCWKMLSRIKKQRTLANADNQFVSKLRPGGLSELEYLICCQAILMYQNQPKAWPASFDDIATQIQTTTGLPIAEALSFMRDFQIEVRLFGDEAKPLEQLSQGVKDHLLSVFKCDSLDELEQAMQSYTAVTKQFEQQVLDQIDAATLGDWVEKPIIWQ